VHDDVIVIVMDDDDKDIIMTLGQNVHKLVPQKFLSEPNTDLLAAGSRRACVGGCEDLCVHTGHKGRQASMTLASYVH